jgi:hypothetical protein
MIWNALSLLTLIAGGWVIFENWWIAAVVGLVKREHSSWIPLIGGGLGCTGCLLSPYTALNRLWWLPLLVDLGCVPGFTYSTVYFAIWFIRGKGRRT